MEFGAKHKPVLKTFWIFVLKLLFEMESIKHDNSSFWCPAGFIPWTHTLPSIHNLPDQVKSRLGPSADDMAICLAISSEGESIALQNDLFTLERWEQRWDMSFNPSKCQALHTTRAKIPPRQDTYFTAVPSAKYLGVTISDNLSWSPHIDSVSKKANQTLEFSKKEYLDS